jgi:CheY-like chemotaxis protein
MAYHILVLDDDPEVLRSIRGWLQHEGFSVSESPSNGSILDPANGNPVDLILLGTGSTPIFDQIESCRLFRNCESTRSIPIILLSQNDPDVVAKGLAAGAADFVVKPLRAEELLVRINLCLQSGHRATGVAGIAQAPSETESQIQRQASFAQYNPNPVLELSSSAAISYCNDAAISMARSLGRENPLEILPPDTTELVKHCLQTGSPRLRVEIPIEARVISWSFFPVALSHTVHCYGGDVTGRKRMEAERDRLIVELQQALTNVKSLSGLLPICASCKKIRDDQGYWSQVERYVQDHSQATFTHGMCPDCAKIYFPGLRKEVKPAIIKQTHS